MISEAYVAVLVLVLQDLAESPAPDALAAQLFLDTEVMQVRHGSVRIELAAPDSLALASDGALDLSAPVEERGSKVREFAYGRTEGGTRVKRRKSDSDKKTRLTRVVVKQGDEILAELDKVVAVDKPEQRSSNLLPRLIDDLDVDGLRGGRKPR